MVSNDMRASVTRAWVLTVMEEFEALSRRVPEVGSLRRPQFVVDPGLSTTLGQWRRQSRRLVLAADLFVSCNWSLVSKVLRHELAHAIVDEVYRRHDEPPHGPSFARACKALGIDPGAKLPKVVRPGDVEHRLLRRVEKLMALGESPNRHEAEAALAKAHELMLRHNLSVAGRSQYAFRWVGPVQSRVPSYTWDIMKVLTDYYFVDYICRPLRDEANARWLRALEIYGTPANLDVAEYVYYFLLREGPREWAAYRREKGLAHGRQRLSFLRGFYQGVLARLGEERRVLSEAHALVWVGDPELERFYEERNPSVHHRRSSYMFYQGAHEAGQQKGQELQLRPGIARGEREGGGGRRLLGD